MLTLRIPYRGEQEGSSLFSLVQLSKMMFLNIPKSRVKEFWPGDSCCS